MMPEIALTQAPPMPAHGSNIGQPLTRRDGVLKVTGAARLRRRQPSRPACSTPCCAVSQDRARPGRRFSTWRRPRRHPGVVEVMTPANRPPLAEDPDAKTNPFMFRLELLQNDSVRYANQPIAVVIAETLEAATEGAALLAPRYEASRRASVSTPARAFVPPAVGVGNPAEMRHGDVEAGLAAASQRIDATYETPAQYHNAMEPHAIVAAWDGDTLSIDTPSQGLAMAQGRIAGLFGIPPENIHIRSPFLGGGFGSKGLMSGPQVLGILAARLVGRPVKLVLRREQMYGPVGHRAADAAAAAPRRRRRRAADRDRPSREGRDQQLRRFLRAGRRRLAHALCEPGDRHLARGGAARHRHAAVHARARRGHRLDRAGERDRRDGVGLRHGPARLPAEELRRGRADLRQAVLLEGAARMLRARRRALRLGERARSRRGRCATRPACWSAGAWAPRPFPALMFAAEARAALRGDGTGVMEIGAHDMGQGAWTALAQIAADGLGLDLDQIEFRSGTSDLPDAGIAGGSAHTATAGIGDPQCRRRRHRQARRPRHRRRALAAVRRRQRRRGRARRPAVPPRRREPQRELRRYPRPRRPCARSRPAARAPPIPAAQSTTTPCTRTARCSPR